MSTMIFRPEVRDGLCRAAIMLARERSNTIYTITTTQLVNNLIHVSNTADE